jgi:hypothetical protein
MKRIFALLFVCLVFSATIASAETRIASLPYTITTSGSYYLSGNLTSTGEGISVKAAHVTIDLKGHTIKGNGIGSGVNTNNFDNVAIMNGTITNFSIGVNNPGTNGKATTVSNIRAVANTSHGIYLDDDGCVVRNSVSARNGGMGIYVFSNGGLVEGNQIYNNGALGMWITFALAINNTVTSNFGMGIHAGPSTIKNNLVFGNTNIGINASPNSFVDGNTVIGNGVANLVCDLCVGQNAVQ